MSTLEQFIGNTPLVRLQRLTKGLDSEIWVKLEGNNPAGSVKDRAALFMIEQAEKRGEIHPGDTLIEATSGNTGIALAMIAALKGYKLKLLMPENMSLERQASMRAYGAELLLVSRAQGMEGARDLALDMEKEGQGKVLDQFNNPDNPLAHFTTTGPEIWQQTQGRITHFVSSMGTTGTITGVSRYLRSQNAGVTIVGLQSLKAAAFRGSAAGHRNICRVFSNLNWSMTSWTWARRKLKTPCVRWRVKKVSSAASAPAVPWRVHYVWQKATQAALSLRSFVIAAIAICRLAFLISDPIFITRM